MLMFVGPEKLILKKMNRQSKSLTTTALHNDNHIILYNLARYNNNNKITCPKFRL